LFHDLTLIRKSVSLKHNETNPAAVYTPNNLPRLKSELKLIPIPVNKLNPTADFLPKLPNDFKAAFQMILCLAHGLLCIKHYSFN
jgi:hypothetical protein